MKNTITIIIAAMAFATTPVVAQETNSENFDELRVGALVGLTGDHISGANADLTYGVVIGYDLAVDDNVLIGLEADALGFNDGVNNSQLSVAARATYTVNDRIAVYGSAGYTSLFVEETFRTFNPIEPIRVPIASLDMTPLRSGTTNNAPVSFTEVVQYDGYRIGGGAEFRVTDVIYASVEYRYSDFDFNGWGDSDVHAALVTVGARF